MKKLILRLLLLILAIAIGAYAWKRGRGAPSEGDASIPSPHEGTVEPVATTDSPPAISNMPAAATAGGQLTATGFIEPKIYCNGDYACLQDPRTAESEADYRWLRKHGYPTREESQRLAALPEAVLQDEVRKGSLTAMTELGTRMTQRNDWKGPSLFSQAADRGSLYAYYAESKAMQMRTAPMGGIVKSGAFLRLAYMLGDYKAARFLQEDVIKRYGATSDVESIRIDERAATLYKTYAKNRPPTPRPME